MFQFGDNDINSYNSFSMNQTVKGEFKSPKLYSSPKKITKKADIDILNTEKAENNDNENQINNLGDAELNLKMRSAGIVTKLPKISNYKIQANIIEKNIYPLNLNQILSATNSIDKGNQNIKQAKHKMPNNEQIKKKNLSKKRKNSLKFGATNYMLNQDKTKSDKTSEPRLGKIKEYIILPDFIGDEPLIEMTFNPILEDNLIKPQNEKQFEINVYLNSHKMLSCLVYSKLPLTKEGLIPIQNIINVKKFFTESKTKDNEDEYEEEKMNQDEQKDKEKQKPSSENENEEVTPLLNLKNKTFLSISEYPGNYIRKTNLKNEREFKFSNNIKNNNISNNNKNEHNEDKIFKRGSMNLNIYEIYKRNQDKSLWNVDNNSAHYINKSIHMSNEIDFFENKTDKNDHSAIINSRDINGEKSKTVILNTIYGDIKPFYKLRDNDDDTLIFESRFECGNLLCAFKTEKDNYQLYLQNDTNTTGYIQWFFFRVSNTKKGKKINFNIINMLRNTCIYKKGLKIITYSKMQAKTENIGWHRDCENVMYYTNNLFIYNDNSKKKRNLNSLSFQYEFKYDNDTVYFANCLPYFYSKLIKEINENEKKFFFLKKDVITQTLGGNDLFILNINSSTQENKLIKDNSIPQLLPKPLNLTNTFNKNKTKKVVFLIARQHPGETVGSYVIEGCINFLLGDSEEAKKLREIYNFYIIPMMNPDGVVVGNSRTGFAGCDLNRRWSKPNDIIHPEIYYSKSIILKTALTHNISFIIDFHGHFGTYNSLFYCNHKEDKKACSLFPYLCSELSDIISFQQTTFSMPKYKSSTERIALFKELDDNDNNNILALETSFFGIRKEDDRKNYYFNKKLLNDIGRDVCLGMLSYYIKIENISLKNDVKFYDDEDKLKKLDLDISQFETEIVKEIKEDDEHEGMERSESEPSIDNLDKKEIMRLMPICQKKKRKKGKNSSNGFNNRMKKLEKYFVKRKNGSEKNNFDKTKNLDLDIELYNPLKPVVVRKSEDENKQKVNNIPQIQSSPSSLSTAIKKSKILHIQNNKCAIVATEPAFKSDYTQTEEIFFRMPWTFFIGKFKIMTGKKRNNNNNKLPNITTIPMNMSLTNSTFINPFSFSASKNNDFFIKAKIRKSNWIKNGVINEKTNLLRNKNSNNIRTIKNGIKNYRELSLRDKANIYLTRFNGFIFNRKILNNGNKITNKGSANKEKNINEYNCYKKTKNNSEGKIIYENIKNA